MNILKSYKYTLEGLDCAACAKKVEDEIANTEGYKDVVVNFSTLKLTFKTNKQKTKKGNNKISPKIRARCRSSRRWGRKSR